MILSHESEPEINIRIPETESRSTKRSSVTQKNKGAPPKKPKVAFLSNNHSDLSAKKTVTETATGQHNIPDVSFRHLFSFATTSQASNQQQDGKKALDATTTFSFLDESNEGEQNINVHAESQFTGPNLDSNCTGMRERDPKTVHSHDMPTAKRISGSSDGRELRDRYKSAGAIGDIAGPDRFLYETGIGQEDQHVEAKRLPSTDVLMIPDDIDARPDQMLQIASSFCRKKSIDQLEEEWCAPGGVRETMRRDFKQKRRNVTRGRKLGSSDKR